MKINTFLLVVCLLFIVNSSVAQDGPVSDAELAKISTHRSLKRMPVDSVYKLTLENPGSIPSDIDRYKRIQRLTIFGNDWDIDLRSLPSGLYKLKNLTHLSVSNTDINGLSNAVKDLKNLTYLNVANNNMVALPKALSGLENLSELVIDNNIRDIPPIPSLEELTIYFQTNQGDDSGSIPNGIPKLESCGTLRIYSEDTKINIPKMMSIIFDMQRIESITFIDPYVSADDIKRLTALRNIRELHLPSLQVPPDVFSGFNNLRALSFGKYLHKDTLKRKAFWETILSLPKLEEVSTIFEVADTGYYARLKRINLRLDPDKPFTEQFEAIAELPSLHTMTFPATSNIPFSLRGLRTVREIDFTDVYNQDFTFVFALISEIPSLEKIIVSNDQFTLFPPETAKLRGLKEMEVYNIQHGAFDVIPEKEKRKAERMLPNCKFIYHE